MAGVFLSYAREDQEAVRRIHDLLVARGCELWVDWEGIEPSDQWMRSIREAIDRADAVLVVVSPDSLVSDVCRQEVEHAAAQNKHLVPVVVRDVDPAQVPPAVAELNWIFAREGTDDLEQAADAIVRAIGTDLDLIRTHTLVLTRAEAWELAGRRASPLLRGEELRRAEEWLARAAAGARPQPTELQALFIQASRRSATQRQRRALGVSIGVAALAIGLSIFALLQRSEADRQRDRARSRELAARATAESQVDPKMALRLAVDAAGFGRTDQAVEALRTALSQDHELFRLGGQQGIVQDVEVSPDGRRAVAAGADGTARIWDIRRGVQTAVLRQGGKVETAVFDPTSTFVVTAGTLGCGIWDASTGRRITDLHVAGAVNMAAFSPDGTRVVTADDDGTTRVFAVTTGGQLAVMTGHKGAVRTARVDPRRGVLVLTAGEDGTARLWNAESGQELRRYDAHTSGLDVGLTDAEFDPRRDEGRHGGSRRRHPDLFCKRSIGDSGRTHRLREEGDVLADGQRVLSSGRRRRHRAPVGRDQPSEPRRFHACRGRARRPLLGGRKARRDGERRRHRRDLGCGSRKPQRASGDLARPFRRGLDGDVHTGWIASRHRRRRRVCTGVGRGQRRTAPSRRPEGDGHAAEISRDGRLVLTAGTGPSAEVANLRTGKVLVRLSSGGDVEDGAFSDDGTRVVTAADDGTARVWSIPEGKKLVELRHDGNRAVRPPSATTDRGSSPAGATEACRLRERRRAARDHGGRRRGHRGRV